ncbi:hypothetical protein [Hoeflea sp.]|uniref:hypothetical protein n=1 Tax=Hoeflea sp. TaxID=1940281 RepID=UPI0025BFEA0D|nr:hypothetical protein [Hoeflea sp.]
MMFHQLCLGVKFDRNSLNPQNFRRLFQTGTQWSNLQRSVNEGALLGNMAAQDAVFSDTGRASAENPKAFPPLPVLAWRLQDQMVGKIQGVIRSPDQTKGWCICRFFFVLRPL